MDSKHGFGKPMVERNLKGARSFSYYRRNIEWQLPTIQANHSAQANYSAKKKFKIPYAEVAVIGNEQLLQCAIKPLQKYTTATSIFSLRIM